MKYVRQNIVGAVPLCLLTRNTIRNTGKKNKNLWNTFIYLAKRYTECSFHYLSLTSLILIFFLNNFNLEICYIVSNRIISVSMLEEIAFL